MPVADSKTVLVVEDDRSILSLVAMVLENEGYRVVTAENGQLGLDAAVRHNPDLVLLDMNMPVMDGWEFARELRATHSRKIPIVVVTASADAHRVAVEIGAVGSVPKPFNLVGLLDIVSRWVN